jgi:hypothetical protein
MISKLITFSLILIGAIIAIYAKAEKNQNVYILVLGIIVLMIGLYRLSKGIPSKSTNQDENVNSEEEE